MAEGTIVRIRELIFDFMPLFHRHISRVFHDREEHRCNKNQNKALFIMKRLGTVNPGSMGACMDMQKGSLTSLVDDLVGMSLVRRENDPDDRRKQRLSLTPEGERYVENRYRSVEARLEDLFRDLPPERSERFARLMEQLVDLMRDLREPESSNNPKE